MAQRDDDVTGTQSAGRRGRIGRHRINPGAGFVQEIEVTHDAPRQREILSADPEIGAPHPSFADQRNRDAFGGTGSDREADALRRQDDRRIHADHRARRIDERSA